jgi:thioredoxin reductase (NADPH)
MSKEGENVKCLIIGSGPAGYTAAIYAARANLDPILFTGKEPGGQLMITNDVENYPGYKDGVLGPAMMEDFKNQALRFGTEIISELIDKVEFTDGGLQKVWSETGKEYIAESVVIATGASAKWLGIESEQAFMNKGVSACAVCDGFFFRGTDVAVVGGGDTAAEEATYLAKLCTKVHLLVRRDEMRASKIMQERVMKTENIIVHWNTLTEEILGNGEVEGVRIKNKNTGEEEELPIKGFFVAIGHKPNTDIFKDQLTLDANGYIKTIPGTAKIDKL